jgi:hypothetical protein
MKSRLSYFLTLSLLATLFVSSAAHADSISITLTEIIKTGAAGATVTFDGTLTNLTGSTIFLNGDGAITASSFLTVNDNPFLNNAPLSLAAGASSGPIALFQVLIAPGTPLGTYSPNSFFILGGANGGAFGQIGSAKFTVNVSPVPEPGTILLLGLGADWHHGNQAAVSETGLSLL